MDYTACRPPYSACRPPCPSPTPGAYSDSCPSSQWCHPTISSSAIPFFSLLQSFPATASFLVSQFFISSGQSIRVSASASDLPMNIQDWSLELTSWISLQFKGFTLTPSMPFWCYMHMRLFGKKGATWPPEGPQSNMVIRFFDSWRQSICPLRFQSPTVKDTKKRAQKWHEGTKHLIRQLGEQHYRTMT